MSLARRAVCATNTSGRVLSVPRRSISRTAVAPTGLQRRDRLGGRNAGVEVDGLEHITHHSWRRRPVAWERAMGTPILAAGSWFNVSPTILRPPWRGPADAGVTNDDHKNDTPNSAPSARTPRHVEDDRQGRVRGPLKTVQVRFMEIHQAYLHTGDAAVCVFEGWDAAGKGGNDPPDGGRDGPARLQGLAHRRAVAGRSSPSLSLALLAAPSRQG